MSGSAEDLGGTHMFDHDTLPQRVLFGAGRVRAHVADAVAALGAKRILLVSAASSRALANELAAALPVAARIGEAAQHVPVENAVLAVQTARDAAADVVVAVGGGSAIGLAKIVARDTGLPIVAVPTTFSGSEATAMWGLTENGRKITGVDPAVLPRAVVYDADLLRSLPPAFVTASAMNAMAHAVDGFWAPRADPINTALGSEGLRALVPGLRRLAEDAGDVAAREQVLYGSYLAAAAFASAGSGLHHKICHALGGSFGMPHAETHAVVIAYVAAFNAPAAPAAAARIEDALGSGSAGAGLWELRDSLGGPASLAELGLDEADIPRAAEIILPAVPAGNPRPVGAADLESLLRAAWSGVRPD